MVELADAQDLGSCAARRVGSTPTTRTKKHADTFVLACFFFAPFCGSVGFCAVFFLKTPKYKQKILRTLRFSTQIRRIFGATDLIRTGDLLITSELLYQLSHSSTLHIFCNEQYSTIFQRICQGWISRRGRSLFSSQVARQHTTKASRAQSGGTRCMGITRSHRLPKVSMACSGHVRQNNASDSGRC